MKNKWTEMNVFINKLYRTMTKDQFVKQFGRYVPNGYLKGCTVTHHRTLSCKTTRQTQKIEGMLKAGLTGPIIMLRW